jgi:hypothetical protein
VQTGANRDTKGNYVSDKECLGPSVLHDFKVPKEKDNTEAYNYFVRWANSGGTDNSDWYKDNQATGILTKFKIKKKKRPLLYSNSY